ncbi:TPA: hypothetical protein DIC40_03145 [Patescibacteria group bacterium]|nr:hypothetical protein [Candidatus Gracilibacteria bacterium]
MHVRVSDAQLFVVHVPLVLSYAVTDCPFVIVPHHGNAHVFTHVFHDARYPALQLTTLQVHRLVDHAVHD